MSDSGHWGIIPWVFLFCNTFLRIIPEKLFLAFRVADLEETVIIDLSMNFGGIYYG